MGSPIRRRQTNTIHSLTHFSFTLSFFIHSFSGLGTSTSKEAKEYFSDMLRHRIKFRHNDEQDDHCIDLAFSKKKIDQRKEWLTNWMEEGKRYVLFLKMVKIGS